VETPEEVKEREAAGRPAPTASVEGDDDEAGEESDDPDHDHQLHQREG